MERGLLSDPALGEFHDDVVWMYLYQDFSGSEADRAAERVAIRFGITSWPQHFLVDPHTLEVLADTGRSLETFGAAVRGSRLRSGPGLTTDELRTYDRLAAALEEDVDAAAAREHLDHVDVVVRFRAIQKLVELEPEAVVTAAAELLGHPHDQTRFLVCNTLAAHPDAATDEVRDVLEMLVRTPTGSKNPNVLRIRCVQALAAVGDADSVAAVAPHAASGIYFNGLTGVAIDALRALADRLPGTRAQITAALARGFPEPPTGDAATERAIRSCTALARRIHDALNEITGEAHPFPPSYTPDTHAALLETWR